MPYPIASVLALALLLSPACFSKNYGHVQSYEPMYVGYTLDEDDVAFMDFKLSLTYPILHSGKPQGAALGFLPYPSFDFTGRFGQYLGTRSSSPVIGKRYNPEVTGRYWIAREDTSRHDSIDLIYGHESNGQSITTQDLYLQQQAVLASEGDDIKDADDYISRGWDYIGILWSHHFTTQNPKDDAMIFFKLHHFLENGLLQGKQEEYQVWEDDPEGKRRKYIDGLSIEFKKNVDLNQEFMRSEKFFFRYVTGIENSFKYHTIRAEFSLTLGNLPIMVWSSYGYNSDLADYYRRLHSHGVAIEILGF